MTSSETDPNVIQIKKYGNRRLYSSSDTRFVTIEEVAGWVRKGRKVRVTDADTDEDITSEILTQILLEGGKAHHFPVELLEQMIRMNEEALKSFWQNYMNQSLRMVLSMQKEMERFYQKLNPFASFWTPAPPQSEPPQPEAQPPPPKRRKAPPKKSE